MIKKKEQCRNGTRLITRDLPMSPITEQYRTMRTNIEYAMIQQGLKTLVFTSALPKEGKSLTISNLAVTFAEQGKKVLLIDADLRKPNIHHYFKLTNVNGLTQVLNKQSQFYNSIVLTDIDSLWVLPSGPIPPKPTQLLGSTSMNEVLTAATQNFDITILDAPPVLSVTDAQILGNICDGTLLVVKSHTVDKESLKKAKDLLDKTKINITGIVLNGSDQKQLR